jgi:AraC-like DNA-binding protein
MVSLRCKMVVKDVLEKLGLRNATVNLGFVDIMETVTPEQREQLKHELLRSGLILLEDPKFILVEKIKTIIIEMVHYCEELPEVKYSQYISQKLGYNYTYLSNVFSEVTGISIRQYIINHKIEKVKELLFYNELNITEISHELHYSSVAHLSNQFKKATGISPFFFKQLKQQHRCTLENVG